MMKMAKKRVIIMGAAGRDFHNFNTYFRNNPEYEVVAFTAAQLPEIAGRNYPPELAGPNYPNGIPIYDESELPELVKKYNVDLVVLAYSDLSFEYVMDRASIVHATGADFMLLGPKETMIKTEKPLIIVTATRTGAGKSTVSRRLGKILSKKGKKIVAIRHPMPYGDLSKQIVQRFATYDDLEKHKVTFEEREEYEHWIDNGFVVYAGVDYEKILRQAEQEADVVIWDGGNNDWSFYKSDKQLYITVADALRPGHELTYWPGS
ncbi:MAG: GTPase, partial [Candidatus Njordarchaeia archaeon]